MLVRSILVFAALTIGYCLLLPYLPPPRPGLTGGTQFEQNRMREESLVCFNRKPDVIIVGSSISAGLGTSLPEGWQSMAMSGFSSIEGLEIIAGSSLEPCTILVESNVVRKSDYQPIGAIEQKVKSLLPSFRTCNKPAHTLLRAIGNAAGMQGGNAKVKEPLDDVPDKRTRSEEVFQVSLERRLKSETKEMDVELLNSELDRMVNLVERLESRGFAFAFMRVPETKETQGSVRKQQLRAAFEKAFPPSDYAWFGDEENIGMYSSNDALHLTAQSALRFSRKLQLGLSDSEQYLTQQKDLRVAEKPEQLKTK